MSSTITQRIKSLLALNNKKAVELAAYMGLSPQSLHNKMARGSFSADDLIKIAEFTGSKLLFENSAGNIALDGDCIRSAAKQGSSDTNGADDLSAAMNSFLSDDDMNKYVLDSKEADSLLNLETLD